MPSSLHVSQQWAMILLSCRITYFQEHHVMALDMTTAEAMSLYMVDAKIGFVVFCMRHHED